jgi:hypothetical protein
MLDSRESAFRFISLWHDSLESPQFKQISHAVGYAVPRAAPRSVFPLDAEGLPDGTDHRVVRDRRLPPAIRNREIIPDSDPQLAAAH